MWKAITSFLPGGETSTSKPAGTFTSVAATSAGLPAQAAPLLKNMKKVNKPVSGSAGISLPTFSTNLKQGVNYADPSNEEEYALKISKPKFNAGDPNPFFVNVPAKKYKVLISDDSETLPTEEITNSTLRFYGSSAENVVKKARTYRKSAKAKHNTLFEKAKTNYTIRGTKKQMNEKKARNAAFKQREAQEMVFRSKIQKANQELSSYLTELGYAKKKIIPATAFKKAEIMTNDKQKRELKRIGMLIGQVTNDLEGLQVEIGKVSGLPPDILTSLQGVLAESKKAASETSTFTEISAQNRNRLRRASETGKIPSPPSSSSGSPTSTSSITAGFGPSSAAVSTSAGSSLSNANKNKIRQRAIEFQNKLKAGEAARKAAAAAPGAGAGNAAAPGAASTVPPPPIQIPTAGTGGTGGLTPNLAMATNSPASTAAVPQPQGAAPPPAPNSPWLGGGSRKRRKQQKKRYAHTAKRKASKSRKH